MQPVSGNQRPHLLTAPMKTPLVLRLPRKMPLLQILFKCSTPAIVFGNATKTLTFCSLLTGAQSLLRLRPETKSERPKVVRTWCVLYILASKCASRHNGVHFFDISTSKRAPYPSVFYTFDFEMCFAPQRRALFQHLNFQKWSEPRVFCTF